MQNSKITINQLHENTGVALTTIKRMKTDNACNPTIASLLPIAYFFNITINQLIGIEPLEKEETLGVYFENRVKWKTLPLINWEDVIDWPNNKPTNLTETVATDIDLSENSYALKVIESNWDSFLKNTILVVDYIIKPTHHNYGIFHKKGEEKASLKYVLIEDGDTYLEPVNNMYKTYPLSDQYICKGTLMQIRRDMDDNKF